MRHFLVLALLASCAPMQQEMIMTAATRDHDAVALTVESVARGADLHQWDVVRAAFADRVELDYGKPEQVTADDIVARWQPMLSAFDATHHVLSDLEISITGDTARVRSRFTATHVMHGDRWVLSGRYEHALARTPSGWRITRMRMVPGESTGNASLLDAARASAAANPATDLRGKNREIVRAFFAKLEAFDIDGFANLFATDGRQLMPFAPEGFPARLDGRAAVFNQYRSLPQNFKSMQFPDLDIVDTGDPSRFVATYRGEIELRAGGTYNNTYVGMFVVRDGHIAEYTEYFNPIVLERAFGANLKNNFNVRH